MKTTIMNSCDNVVSVMNPRQQPRSMEASGRKPPPRRMDNTEPYQSLQRGDMLNWYRIERVLGRGGFGVIYLATDTNLDYQVAIKEYRVLAPAGSSETRLLTEERSSSARQGMQRFIDEARNLVRFNHVNIVRVMSVFELHGSAYIVMEYEQGIDLRQHLATPGAVTEAALKSLFVPIIDGLKLVHEAGFIHRDIKPTNIMVRPDGSPVLLDFGSARNPGPLSSETLTALVSAGYAPLEQYSGGSERQQGPWTDIYALGAVLYFAVTGTEPVDSAKRGSALLNGGKDPLIPARLLGQTRYSPAFLDAIDWALQFRISARPQTLADWSRSLITVTSQDDATRRVSADDQQSLRALDASTTAEFDAVMMHDEPVPREVEAARLRRSRRSPHTMKRWLGLAALLVGATVAGAGWWTLNDRVPDGISIPDSGVVNADNSAIKIAADKLAVAEKAEREAAEEAAEREAGLLSAEKAREAARAESVRAAAADEAEKAKVAAAQAAEEQGRQRERRRQLNRHLDRAVTTIEAGLLDDAEEALDSAALINRRDPRLIKLRLRWRTALVDARTPVSDSDFDFVIAQFDALRRAIEGNDIDAVDKLTETSDQNLLFRQLLSRFAKLNIKIYKIRVRNADKSITAALRIENMVRANADRATPSAAYQERTITSRRIEGKWSLIKW